MFVIFAEPDVFSSVRKNQANETQDLVVRRPITGMELKAETFATLRVINSSGAAVPLRNSSRASGQHTMTANFILVQVSEGRQEKSQILETFGETYGFFYGEHPVVISCAAVLVNSQDFNWVSEWMANYNENLRATKLVEKDARAYLSFDQTVVEGYLLSTSISRSSENPLQVVVNFSMWVTATIDLTEPGAGVYTRGDGSMVTMEYENSPEYLHTGTLTAVSGDVDWGGTPATQSFDPNSPIQSWEAQEPEEAQSLFIGADWGRSTQSGDLFANSQQGVSGEAGTAGGDVLGGATAISGDSTTQEATGRVEGSRGSFADNALGPA